MAAAGTAAKAAGAVAAGGGPEDPVGDAAAAGIVVKDTVASKSAQKGVKDTADTAAKNGGGGGGGGGDQKGGKGPGGGGKPSGSKKGQKKDLKRAVNWAWSGDRRFLTAQYVLCLLVLLAGTMTAPEDSDDTWMRCLVKASALNALFFLLSVVTTAGKGPGRAATAVGTLVTASYVLTSSDVHNVVSWAAGFFAKPTAEDTATPAGGDDQ